MSPSPRAALLRFVPSAAVPSAAVPSAAVVLASVVLTCAGCARTPRTQGGFVAVSEARTAQARTSEAPRFVVPTELLTGSTVESSATGALRCPSGMVLVEGNYCPRVEHTCLKWLDPPGPYHQYRCAEYARPARCLSPRTAVRFCIDREEYVAPEDALPLNNQSWTTADALCRGEGKRLCLESEWQFACEGEEMRPYPYGFRRDATLCNIDRTNLGKPQEGLRDLREPITGHPGCVSPFGVHGMSGNIEEWATRDEGKAPFREAMKGAWWLPGKNTCRAVTMGHGEIYSGPQVGVRCCSDGP